MSQYRCFYTILGVPRSASAGEIEAAYRRLSKKFHPDTNQQDASAAHKFKELTYAYDVLSDPKERGDYDDNLEQLELEFERQMEAERREKAKTSLTVPPKATPVKRASNKSASTTESKPNKNAATRRKRLIGGNPIRQKILGIPGLIGFLLLSFTILAIIFVSNYKTRDDMVREILTEAQIALDADDFDSATGLVKKASLIEGNHNDYEIKKFSELLDTRVADKKRKDAEKLAQNAKNLAQEAERLAQEKKLKAAAKAAAEEAASQEDERERLAKSSTYKTIGGTISTIYDLDGNLDQRKLRLRAGESLRNLKLNEINLNKADLTGCNFSGTGASFVGTKFSNGDLTGVNFTFANLTKASFANANLSGTDFSHANLSGAIFSNANLTGADFYGAKGIESADFSGAWCNARSRPRSLASGIALKVVGGKTNKPIQKKTASKPTKKQVSPKNEISTKKKKKAPGSLLIPQRLDEVREFLTGKTKQEVKQYMQRAPDVVGRNGPHIEKWGFKGQFHDTLTEKTYTSLVVTFTNSNDWRASEALFFLY